jgi:Replication-relaxation
LNALDEAAGMRFLRAAPAGSAVRLAPGDRELLAWLAGARCALSTQIHRRMHPERSLTGTQRQLKRLADRGLIARFQLHRDDGGGLPLCCAVTARALELLGITARAAPELRESHLDALRADVRLTGWLLALESHAALCEILGPGRAAIAPGRREAPTLEFEHGLRPRDFLITGRDGVRAAVERFAPLRPGAVVCTDGGNDVIVVFDRDGKAEPGLIEAYDHFVSGWWRSVDRYRRAGMAPTVVFVCRDQAAALERVAMADKLLSACLAQIGVGPEQWARPGRAAISFAAEQDAHDGLLIAWSAPTLPPQLRAENESTPLRAPFMQAAPAVAGTAAQPPWL